MACFAGISEADFASLLGQKESENTNNKIYII